ncbi:hypothetical protein OQA88_12554 [Cercophora sp. LCS_1]
MPLFYRPSRDSRHRRACLSLYRALMRTGLRVPLPDDVATGLGPINPIRSLIRNAFRRNRKEASPRLVVSALKQGYRFLTVLHTAASAPTGPVYNEVLSFLRKNQAAVQKVLAAKAAKAKVEPSARPVSLLTRVQEATLTSAPVYEATARPLPLEALSGGVRKIPKLDDTEGIPFLRLGKPQAAALSAILTRKVSKRRARTVKLCELEDEELEIAAEEDFWDELVQRLMRENGVQIERPFVEMTYEDAFQRWRDQLQTSLNWEKEDMVARGKALWKLVEAEMALAKEEKEERRKQGQVEATEPKAKAKKGKKTKDMKARQGTEEKETIEGVEQISGEEVEGGKQGVIGAGKLKAKAKEGSKKVKDKKARLGTEDKKARKGIKQVSFRKIFRDKEGKQTPQGEQRTEPREEPKTL